MVQKQSQLSLTPEGAKVLQKRGIKHVEPSVFVKGVLYEPLNEAYQVEHHPDTNPQGLRGWWVHHGQVDRLLQQTQGCQWLYLPRLFWLSEASADRQRPGPLEVLDVASRSPVHVAAMRLEDGVWHEQSRGFIVPDSWPGGL